MVFQSQAKLEVLKQLKLLVEPNEWTRRYHYYNRPEEGAVKKVLDCKRYSINIEKLMQRYQCSSQQ